MTFRTCALLAGISLSTVVSAQPPRQYTIETFAGKGERGFEGDSAAATNAKLAGPQGLAIDGSGNLYIADVVNNRIRRVGSDGNISTVVGNGTPGFEGDNAAATSARINSPAGMGLSSGGTMYVADTYNQRVRQVAIGGNITEFAGSGTAGSEDPVEDEDNPGIDAKFAQLNYPMAVAVNSSNRVFIADSVNNRIRVVGTDGKITTFAGTTGTAGSAGDGGPATSARLRNPLALAIDSAGNVYISDSHNHKIRKVATDGTITTVAGNGSAGFSGDGGPATQAKLFYPKGIAVDSQGYLYIVDSYNFRIRMVTPEGAIYTIAGTGKLGWAGDGGPALDAYFAWPYGIAVDSARRLYVSDTGNQRVRRLTPVLTGGNDAEPPVISEGGVLSSSDFGLAGGITVGSSIDVHGLRFSGGRVYVGGAAAETIDASDTRLRVRLPESLAPGVHLLKVVTPAGESNPYEFSIESRQPRSITPDTRASM